MRRRRVTQLSATVIACLLASACEGPTRPSSPNPQPNPPPDAPTGSLATLAGTYSLTLQISDQCSGIPTAVRRRIYRATLEQTRYGYLGVRIVGEGFSQPVTIADMYAGQDAQVVLRWNDFDLGSCFDTYPEPLAADAFLTVCGAGNGRRDGSTIAGTLNASTWIDEGGLRGTVCRGAHEFTFTRIE
jgi:hypothetical protein